MSKYEVDFQEAKALASMEQVACWLGLDKRLQRKSDHFRGPCPICNAKDQFRLTFRSDKFRDGAFHCFKCGAGGADTLELVSQLDGNPKKSPEGLIAAAKKIRAQFGPTQPVQTVPKEKAEVGEGLTPLAYLVPDHEALAGLGVTAETLRHFGAGYAPKGIMRGRLAIPVRDKDGTLLAYCGRAVKEDEEPQAIFPKNFDPCGALFNVERVAAGELTLVSDPLRVLTAFEAGFENVVSTFGPGMSPAQLRLLAEVMDERCCPELDVFA